MKKEDENIKRLYSFLNGVTGKKTVREQQTILSVLRKTMDEVHELLVEGPDGELGPVPDDMNMIYMIMSQVAYEFNVQNPFPDKEKFYNIYKTLEDFDQVTWADILEYGSDKEEFKVPESVAKLMEKNCISGFEEVLIPEAEKFSYVLESLTTTYDESHFTLMTTDLLYYKLLTEMYTFNEMVDVELGDIYKTNFTDENYHVILAAPSFGRGRANESSDFIGKDYDMIAIQNLAAHLTKKEEGTLSIVMPAKITFGGGQTKQLRDYLISKYNVKEIASLPAGVFNTTRVKTCLINISTDKTDGVQVKRYVFDKNNQNNEETTNLVAEDETTLLNDKFVKMHDWNVDRIFELQDDEWLSFQESEVEKRKLGDVATVFRGKVVRKQDMDNKDGNIRVINISNIGNYDIDYSSLESFKEEQRKVANYILQDGDLLIPARGTAIRVAVFKEQSYPCIASSNVIVIRAKNKELNPVYLKVFFDSSLGRKILMLHQQGTYIMNISYKELNNVEIPFLPSEEQQTIADEYTAGLEEYRKAMQTAEYKWSTTLERLQSKF